MYFAFIVRNMSSSRVFWFHLKRLAVSRFGVLLPDCVLFEAQKEVGSLSSAASIGHASEADFLFGTSLSKRRRVFNLEELNLMRACVCPGRVRTRRGICSIQ